MCGARWVQMHRLDKLLCTVVPSFVYLLLEFQPSSLHLCYFVLVLIIVRFFQQTLVYAQLRMTGASDDRKTERFDENNFFR